MVRQKYASKPMSSLIRALLKILPDVCRVSASKTRSELVNEYDYHSRNYSSAKAQTTLQSERVEYDLKWQRERSDYWQFIGIATPIAK